MLQSSNKNATTQLHGDEYQSARETVRRLNTRLTELAVPKTYAGITTIDDGIQSDRISAMIFAAPNVKPEVIEEFLCKVDKGDSIPFQAYEDISTRKFRPLGTAIGRLESLEIGQIYRYLPTLNFGLERDYWDGRFVHVQILKKLGNAYEITGRGVDGEELGPGTALDKSFCFPRDLEVLPFHRTLKDPILRPTTRLLWRNIDVAMRDSSAELTQYVPCDCRRDLELHPTPRFYRGT